MFKHYENNVKKAIQNGVYSPSNEHDACGIGFVANIKNNASHQKLTPSIGKIDNEEIYYGFGYNGVGVSAAHWSGKQLSKLVFSSNSKELDISKIYKGLPKKFIFPQLRTFYFRLAVWFYAIKDKLNI